MDAEVSKFEFGPLQVKWLEALESGNYIQGNGSLRSRAFSADGKHAYCCLGVLCEVAGLEWQAATVKCGCGNEDCNYQSQKEGFHFQGDIANGYLPTGFSQVVGLRNKRGDFANKVKVKGREYKASSLASFNDTFRLGFPEIAAYIRKNPQNVFTHSA